MGLLLPLILLAGCGGSSPIDGPITALSVTLVSRDSGRIPLHLDQPTTAKVAACLQESRAIPDSEAIKMVFVEGSYEVSFTDSGGEHLWTLQNVENLLAGDQFYKNRCLYPLVQTDPPKPEAE